MAKLPKIYRSSSPTVAVIGAGIIGLACALELTRRGATVALYDKQAPGRGASWAAAGMLSPAFEAASEETAHPRLFDLCLESALMWPAFVDNLGAGTNADLSYSSGQTLAVDMEGDDGHMPALRAALENKRVPHDVLSSQEACQLEPTLSPDNRGALLLPTDGRVDNRTIFRELWRRAGDDNRLSHRTVQAPLKRAADGGLRLDGADRIVLAAGFETPRIPVQQSSDKNTGAADPTLEAIRPVSGQMLAFVSDAPLTYTLRSGSHYVTPRGGTIVAGASVEPGVLSAPTEAVIADLKARAGALVPMLAMTDTQTAWVGTRPGTPDHAPLLGETACPGVYVAAGHYRNGILLAPVTAKLMADMVLDDEIGDLAAAFSPRRFASAVD